MPPETVLKGYAADAPELIARFEAISPESLYAPMIDLLPPPGARAVDIGAGTGRDGAWLADRGHTVLAVEPVKALREAGMSLHRRERMTWLDDRLPHLVRTRGHGRFDLVLLCAVWQRLSDCEKQLAMTSLHDITAEGGTVIMSLRHRPGAPGRQIFPVTPEDTIEAAARAGFRLKHCREANSLQPGNQASGVRWTWLALESC